MRRSPLNILVVDDDEFYSEVLKKRLEISFPLDNFIFVNSKKSAIDNFSKEIDIAIVDFMLDEGLGSYLIKDMKDINDKTEFIVITSSPFIEVERVCKQLSVFDYISKNGFEYDKLRQTLTNLTYFVSIMT